jgi:hypothetical protein
MVVQVSLMWFLGTENVLEKAELQKESASGLKKVGDIILVPQPTDDPNDPLVSEGRI